jgi:hypothetical protein
MQKYIDDMLGVLTESITIFFRSLGLFAQSIEKLVQSRDVFPYSVDKWA